MSYLNFWSNDLSLLLDMVDSGVVLWRRAWAKSQAARAKKNETSYNIKDLGDELSHGNSNKQANRNDNMNSSGINADGVTSTPLNKDERNKNDILLDLSPPLELTSEHDNEVPESIIEKHHELGLARDLTGEINPVNCAHRMFNHNQDMIIRSETPHEAILHRQSPPPPGISTTTTANQQPSQYLSKLLDPMVPYTLALYLQLLVNIIIVSMVLYFIYIFIRTIQADINHKLDLHTIDALHEIAQCSNQYIRNRCHSPNRAPAIERECLLLEKCRNRDVSKLAKSKITAETFADILNGFLNGISWKSLLLINGLIWGGLVVLNVVFGSYRSMKYAEDKMIGEKLRVLESKIRDQEEVIRKYEMMEVGKDVIELSPLSAKMQR